LIIFPGVGNEFVADNVSPRIFLNFKPILSAVTQASASPGMTGWRKRASLMPLKKWHFAPRVVFDFAQSKLR